MIVCGHEFEGATWHACKSATRLDWTLALSFPIFHLPYHGYHRSLASIPQLALGYCCRCWSIAYCPTYLPRLLLPTRLLSSVPPRIEAKTPYSNHHLLIVIAVDSRHQLLLAPLGLSWQTNCRQTWLPLLQVLPLASHLPFLSCNITLVFLWWP